MAGPALEEHFEQVVDRLAGRFMAQAAISDAYLHSEGIDEFFSAFEGHPLSSFSSLLDDYSPDIRSLTGDLAEVFGGLKSSIDDGLITAANAAVAVYFLQLDMSEDVDQFALLVEEAALEAGFSTDSTFYVELQSQRGSEIVNWQCRR